MLYSWALSLHNLTRWLVLATGFWAIWRLVGGWRAGRAWTRRDRLSMRAFAIVLSLQFVFGALIYWLPNGFSSGMRQSFSLAELVKLRVPRFFVIEHPLQMVIAIGISHMANFFTRRARDDRRRFKLGSLMLIVAMLLILIAIPWPFLSHGRPLARLP